LSGNKAAVLILNQDDKKLSEVHVFSTTEHLRYQENSTEQKKTLIGTFKKFLNKEAQDLIKLFRQKDSANSNSIKASEWSSILSQYISKKYDNKIDAEHFLTLRKHLCPNDDGSNMINYMRMFETEDCNERKMMILDILESYFQIIDLDCNGTISKHESQEALQFINKTMGTNYTVEFLNSMDTNNDDEIDLEEFKNGFCLAYDL
jgi:Ca2+-binding EF-hand superfamily protein